MIADGKNAQSSRMIYENKDHKDIVYNDKFHSALAYKDADADRYDLVWRKMFPDRYFIYRAIESQSGPLGICYPKEKINIGTPFQFPLGTYMGRTDKYMMHIGSYGYFDNITVYSEDGRVRTKSKKTAPISRADAVAYSKSGVMFRDYSTGNWYLCTLIDGKPNYPCEIGSFVKALNVGEVGSRYVSYCYDIEGNSDHVLFYYQENGNNIYYDVDTKSKNISRTELPAVVYGDTVIDRFALHHVGNRDIVVTHGGDGWSNNERFSLYELSGGIFTFLCDIPARFYSSNIGATVKYNNGLYYIYISFYKDRNGSKQTKLYTTSNFTSLTEISLPDSITLKDIDGNNPISIPLNTNSNINVLSAQSMAQHPNIIYEKNKKLIDAPCVSFVDSFGIIYFDNLNLQATEGSFYFADRNYNSLIENEQRMFKKYYSEE